MTENKGDLISREALKEKIWRSDVSTREKISNLIDNAPTVEPAFKPIAEVKFDKEQLQEIVDKAKAEVLASVERPQGEWVPITMRKLTPEEKREINERYGADVGDEARAFNCRMPEDGQKVFITTSWGAVTIDIFHVDPDGNYFEDHEDSDDVIAWRPLIEPYKEE